jgi:hypothetical protein
MKTIDKFLLKTTPGLQSILLPKESTILLVQYVFDGPYIWALVNPNNVREEIKVQTFLEKEEMPDNFNGKYLGNYLLEDSLRVHHVFLV